MEVRKKCSQEIGIIKSKNKIIFLLFFVFEFLNKNKIIVKNRAKATAQISFQNKKIKLWTGWSSQGFIIFSEKFWAFKR